jgi:AraC-like DNA-binding protein
MVVSRKIPIFVSDMVISAFFIGVSTAFFAIFAVHILCFRRRRTRFQTVLGCIMAVWAVWSLKDLLLTFPGMYRSDVLDWVLMVDGWSALTYTVFVAEAVKPGWATARRLLALALPFAAFTAVYACWPRHEVVWAYVLFLWCYAWTVVIVGFWQVRRYILYVRANYSNIDHIDVSWMIPVFIFAVVSQLSWLVTSVYATQTGDVVYYVSAILLWLMVLYSSWEYRPITVVEEAPTESETDSSRQAPQPKGPSASLADGLLERVVDEQQLYLNPNLTLQDLAQALKSNRTYVSNYLSQSRGQTFYDYINQLRIERVSLPMMQRHPEYKLEHVARESGFASISTFRRAFIKQTGQTPGQYESLSAKMSDAK